MVSGIMTFEDLACYQKAREFRCSISRFCKGLPHEEVYKLKDQMIRASRSVTANIAEGYGRHHHQENLQFCRQARGSLSEMLDHLNVAKDDEYLKEDLYNELREKLKETWKILNGYISYLKKCAQNGVPDDSQLLDGQITRN